MCIFVKSEPPFRPEMQLRCIQRIFQVISIAEPPLQLSTSSVNGVCAVHVDVLLKTCNAITSLLILSNSSLIGYKVFESVNGFKSFLDSVLLLSEVGEHWCSGKKEFEE
ncbi:hypothetical protein H9L39_04620 [Fusarium oxysporum f. sp. albedinis]|nr:hypothetical protein H9L39_04620 [Fusarium oxysporum f. sp. albedinis]